MRLIFVSVQLYRKSARAVKRCFKIEPHCSNQKYTDPGMNYLVSLVALIGMGRGGERCCWINSHKESGSCLLSRSTAEGPSHQKLMSYLDHAVSSALYWENTAELGRKGLLHMCVSVCVYLLYAVCVSYLQREIDSWENKAVVIMNVQLFEHCSLQMLCTGCNPYFLSSIVKTKLLLMCKATVRLFRHCNGFCSSVCGLQRKLGPSHSLFSTFSLVILSETQYTL